MTHPPARFEPLSRHLVETREPPSGGGLGRVWPCVCGRPVFFRNSLCLFCGTPLGYEGTQCRIVPIAPAGVEQVWRDAAHPEAPERWTRCANFETPAGCNWLLPRAEDEAPEAEPTRLCVACRLNRTIPDLAQDDNALLWHRIELAKRRLVSQLLQLRLPVASRVEDPERGLAFDLLRSPPEGPRVLTGHADGLITLDIEEADDARREAVRTAMGEPYRTLLGHFRHEIGHYYWQRLVDGTEWHAPFRELFGDETADYAAAIAANASSGPRADWEHEHVSAYASIHPWEDWAETFAHYLHMVDVVQTGIGFGLEAAGEAMNVTPFEADALWRPEGEDAAAFLRFVNAWVGLTCVLNEMSRSMGQPDFYPFVLPSPVLAKLQFIHCVVSAAAASSAG